MSYLLDTNVVSELRKGGRADAGVREWFAACPDEQLFLSVLVVGELRLGIERIRRRDPASARALERWVRGLVRDFAERILPVDVEVAEAWGQLGAEASLPPVDALIGATALAHDLTVVTRNERDIARTGAAWLNPFRRRPTRGSG